MGRNPSQYPTRKILVFSDESGPSASEKISRGCRPAPPKFALHGTTFSYFRHIFGFYLKPNSCDCINRMESRVNLHPAPRSARAGRSRRAGWNPLAYRYYTNTRGPVDHVGCDVMGRGVPLLAYMSMQLLYEWWLVPAARRLAFGRFLSTLAPLGAALALGTLLPPLAAALLVRLSFLLESLSSLGSLLRFMSC